MANTSYDYVIVDEFPNDVAEPEVLELEIVNSDPAITSAALLGTACDGDPQSPTASTTLKIWFDDPLSAGDQAQLDVLVAAHQGVQNKDIDTRGAVATTDKFILQPADSKTDESIALSRDGSNNMMLQDAIQTTPVSLTTLLNSGAPGNRPTGFPNRTDSTISFVDGTRTFTIEPVASSFNFYVSDGDEYIKSSAQTVVIPDVEGIHFIYFNGSGTLVSSTTWSDDIILTHAFVSLIYWDATNSEAILIADERHGIVMDGATHLHMHNSFGTMFYSGLALNSVLADEDGSLDTHAQVGTDSGVIADEDIVFSIAADSAPAQIPVFYRDGASGYWRRNTASNFPVYSYSGGSGRLAYNEWTGSTWQQTEVGNNQFVLAHLFATDDPNQQWIAIQGQQSYSNIGEARTGGESELSSLILGGLPTKEFTAVATLIFQTSSGYSNTPKARVRSAESGDWIDWRYSGVSPTTPPSENFEEEHKALRQLIHFIESGGPAEGFASGAYREVTGTVFPTVITWWESSSKLQKIVERTLTWTGVTLTTDLWEMYAADGVSVVATVSDSISYSGVFETSRTRTIG